MAAILWLALASSAQSADQPHTSEYTNQLTRIYSYIEMGGSSNTHQEVIYSTSNSITVTVTNITGYMGPGGWNVEMDVT